MKHARVSPEPKPPSGFVQRILAWLWREIDPLVALSIGVSAAALASLNKLPGEFVTPLLLSTISLVAFMILRDREQRHQLAESLGGLAAAIQPPDASAVFRSRSSEIPVIEHARHEVWAVQETGSLLIETCRKEIVALLERGGLLRLVVTAPTENTLRALALRNASLTDYQAIQGRAATFRHLIRDLCQGRPDFAERMEVRYVPYAVGETFVLTDASRASDEATLLLRVAGFGVPYERKLDLTCDRNGSAELFALYRDQFQRFFRMSSKIVLLTGKPRSGKTTLMEALLNEIGATDAAYTAVSPADMRGDRRVGFTVRTSLGTTRTFATRQEGEYAVDVAAWDDVAAEMDAARLAGKVLLIDEIGPMQARSAAFRTAVEAVLADERATLIATLAGADEFPLRKSLLLHHRSTLISLDRVADRHSVAATLRDAAVGAIELSTIMPRSQW